MECAAGWQWHRRAPLNWNTWVNGVKRASSGVITEWGGWKDAETVLWLAALRTDGTISLLTLRRKLCRCRASCWDRHYPANKHGEYSEIAQRTSKPVSTLVAERRMASFMNGISRHPCYNMVDCRIAVCRSVDGRVQRHRRQLCWQSEIQFLVVACSSSSR